MSDGPHKSLDMRRGWKRVAERADNQNFEADEVAHALTRALEQDCQVDMRPEFVDAFNAIGHDQEASLFKDDVRPSLEALRDLAGCGIGRLALEYAIQAAACGAAVGMDIPVIGLANALKDRAERGKWHVEEHYCRKSNTPRAHDVRDRIGEAIDRSDTSQLARQVLKLEPKSAAKPAKQRGLDDGVKL